MASIRTTTQTQNDLIASVYENTTEAISGQVLQDRLLDMAVSYINRVTDKQFLNLQEFSSSRGYDVGECVVRSGILYQCSTAHTGAWNAANFTVIVATGSYLPLAGGTMTGNILFSGGYGIDTTSAGGSDTLNIGATNADIINIGRSGAIVNILGTTLYENITNLQVTDKLITLNKGGAATTGTGVGFEIEENSVITGYFKTNTSRNAYSFLTPAIAYKADLSLASLTADRVFTLPDATGTFALTGNKLSVFAATSSAELAGVISDETGTGALVFSISPTLTGTPLAPTASVGTNTTQLATTAFVNAQITALFTDAGSYTYLTSTTDHLLLGTSTNDTAQLVVAYDASVDDAVYFKGSSNTVAKIGGGTGGNGGRLHLLNLSGVVSILSDSSPNVINYIDNGTSAKYIIGGKLSTGDGARVEVVFDRAVHYGQQWSDTTGVIAYVHSTAAGKGALFLTNSNVIKTKIDSNSSGFSYFNAGNGTYFGTSLSLSATVGVQGSGTTSGTTGFAVHNSTGTSNSLVVLDNGAVGVGMIPVKTLDVTGTFGVSGVSTFSLSTTSGAGSSLISSSMTASAQTIDANAHSLSYSVTPTADVFGRALRIDFGNYGTQNLTGTAGQMGVFVLAQNNSTAGTIANFSGVYADVRNNSTGIITNLYGFRVPVAVNGGGGTVTNFYGVRVQAQTIGSTLSAGIALENTAASGRYNVYASGTAQNYFAGSVGILTTSPDSKLHVVGETAASPATSGTTTAGLIARLQGGGSSAGLDLGSNGTTGSWLQVTNRTDQSLTYPLLINPNGGIVGINTGTATPVGLVEIAGTYTNTHATLSNDGLVISNRSANVAAQITFRATNGLGYPSGMGTSGAKIGAVADGASAFATDLVFSTRLLSALNERMRIKSTGVVQIGALTASQAIFTDASSNLVSNAITGTGNVVMSTSPTLVTPLLGTPTSGVLSNCTSTTQAVNDDSTKLATTAYADRNKVFTATVTLTSAEIKALFTTPKLLVAAPGSGKYIDVISVTGQLTFVTAPYAVYTTLRVQTAGATGNNSMFYDDACLPGTVSKNVKFSPTAASSSGADVQLIDNGVVNLQALGGDPTLGSGTLKISVLYRIVTI